MSIYLCCCGIPPDDNPQPPTRPNTPAYSKEKVTFKDFINEDQFMRRKTVSNIAVEVLNTEKK